ncbi:MFS transporter [Alsobacter sp. SYSU BS001988]
MSGEEAAAAAPAARSPDAFLWVWPLAATLGIQTASSFLLRLIPTIAPVLTASLGLSPEAIGSISSVGTVGSMLFLAIGHPLIRRFGPIRTLQIGLLLGGLGLALLTPPWWAAAYGASLLLGLGYGPSAPAGSDILLRHSPAAHRTLIFSLKQAGVPLGGVLAGLALPWLVGLMDWRAALLAVALLPLATVLLVQPLRERIDVDRDPGQPIGPSVLLSPANMLRPLRLVVSSPPLRGLTLAGCCFAIGQGSLFAFTVTWLVGLGYGLAEAGLVFAVMQATGVFGRVLLGWTSDRIGSGMPTLRFTAVSACATMLALASASAAWPFWALLLLAGVAGVTVSSWNGVHLAEVARHSPQGRVGETTAGATLITFIGYVVGPAGFGLALGALGGYPAAFLGVAAVSLVAFAGLIWSAREG